MSRPGKFRMDVDRVFPHLANSPVVEAAIHWQASPTKPMDRDALNRELTERFSAYSLQVQQRIVAGLTATPEGTETHQRTQWDGFRLISADKMHVCQMKPKSVVFSRLTPYENWSNFIGEAILFWDCFVELCAPVAIERLGVRFINQMCMERSEDPSKLVNEPALKSIGLPQSSFFREDSLEVTGHPYRVNLVRATQGPQPPLMPERLLLVDIDAFTTVPTPIDKAAIEARLKELRFLKNFVFFNFVKDSQKRFAGD